MLKKYRIFILFIIAIAFSISFSYSQNNGLANSLGLYVFPSNGQTGEEQSQAEAECFGWAKEQTGVDPMNPPKVQAEQVNRGPDGSGIRGAARGAAAGAAIGAIAGDAGKGAAIGALAGGIRARRAARAQKQYQQAVNNQVAYESEQALMNNFKKAFTACMEGKGYNVK